MNNFAKLIQCVSNLYFIAIHSVKSWRLQKDNMTSRKKIKGKDRKAKQAKQEADKIEKAREKARCEWVGWASGGGFQCRLAYNSSGRGIVCDHGFGDLIPDEHNHPVCAFMDTFFMDYWDRENIGISELLNNTYKKQPQVWDNDNHRRLARDFFVSIGTNLILGRETNGPEYIAMIIMVLENYDHTSDINTIIHERGIASKIRDLYCGGNITERREVLKFYRKRTSCSCLKKMHLEARKDTPKLGDCYHCLRIKERATLMVCSRCRVAQYCSRECQVAAWPKHKEGECDHFVCASRKKNTNS